MSEEAEISERLWNSQIHADTYEETREKYQSAILEQYKLYVEMADRISNRRGLANTFFLTLNTAVATLATPFINNGTFEATTLSCFPLIVLVGECAG